MAHVRVPAANFLVVGDSTAHRFEGVILEHPRGPAVVKARWQPQSRMRDLWQDGKISEYLTRILMEMRWVKRSSDTHWPFPSLPEGVTGTGPTFDYGPRDPNRCVLLFSYESDMLDLWNHYLSRPFDERHAIEALTASCKPLFDAVRTLKQIGYEHVFLHGITPPTRIERPRFASFAVRMRLARIVEDLFERFAGEAGIGLISIWDEVFSEEHGRNPLYTRDHLHLNAASAVLSAQRLSEQLERRGFYEAIAGARPEYPNDSMSCA